jgi:hypothetical protein
MVGANRSQGVGLPPPGKAGWVRKWEVVTDQLSTRGTKSNAAAGAAARASGSFLAIPMSRLRPS